jgi:hypothetical protein
MKRLVKKAEDLYKYTDLNDNAKDKVLRDYWKDHKEYCSGWLDELDTDFNSLKGKYFPNSKLLYSVKTKAQIHECEDVIVWGKVNLYDVMFYNKIEFSKEELTFMKDFLGTATFSSYETINLYKSNSTGDIDYSSPLSDFAEDVKEATDRFEKGIKEREDLNGLDIDGLVKKVANIYNNLIPSTIADFIEEVKADGQDDYERWVDSVVYDILDDNQAIYNENGDIVA